jgi:hypothetical protein
MLEAEQTLGPQCCWNDYVNGKDSNDVIGNRTRGFAACIIVPQKQIAISPFAE